MEFDLGGERYLRTGETLPDDELERLRTMDAILLGAVGHPRRAARASSSATCCCGSGSSWTST